MSLCKPWRRLSEGCVGLWAGNPVASEYVRNHRTYEYYRSKAREANVNNIITGQAPIGQINLYPVNCSHQGLLSIDHKLVSPSPDFVAPEVQGSRRWVNDHQGWAGSEAPRGWPSSEFGHFTRGVRPLYS